MTPDDLVERVAQGIATTQDDDWNNPALFIVDANDTAESGREAYRDMARVAIAIVLEGAAKVAELAPYNRGGMVCGCSEGLSNWTAAAIRAMMEKKND